MKVRGLPSTGGTGRRLIFCLVLASSLLGLEGSAAASTTWVSATPPAKFVQYAKHVHSHGMQAWYPSRIPKGFRILSFKMGDMTGMEGTSRPYCKIVFGSGSSRIYFDQSPYVGVDAPSVGTTAWGVSKAEWYDGWAIWFGPHSEQAELHGKGISKSAARTLAKYMRKIQ
jgi:hypothetical protein